MSLIESMKWRYATKVFDPSQKLSEDQLNLLLEVANLTPTSYGLQAIRVVLVENKELREQIMPHAWGQKQVVDASHLLVLAAVLPEKLEENAMRHIDLTAQTRGVAVESLDGYKNMVLNTIKNRSSEELLTWASKQAYIMLGNLMTAAAELGIDTCPMEGFVPDQVDQVLDMKSKGLRTVLMLPVGFRSLEDKYATLPKVRMPLAQFVQRI